MLTATMLLNGGDSSGLWTKSNFASRGGRFSDGGEEGAMSSSTRLAPPKSQWTAVPRAYVRVSMCVYMALLPPPTATSSLQEGGNRMRKKLFCDIGEKSSAAAVPLGIS